MCELSPLRYKRNLPETIFALVDTYPVHVVHVLLLSHAEIYFFVIWIFHMIIKFRKNLYSIF